MESTTEAYFSNATFSIVVPFYNESENLPRLIQEIDDVLLSMKAPAEIILVDDASTDEPEKPSASPHFSIRWLRLTERSGQSAAIYYGIQEASGKYVILMDADLQNDPADIPRLFEKIETDKLDLVTGIRVRREDNAVRRYSSIIANAVRSTLLRDRTTDTGCSLKIMRRELARRLPGWNGMHRFIPSFAVAMGYTVGEIEVNHRPRVAGVSKVIGWQRAIRATVDLIGMLWLTRRQFKGVPESDELPRVAPKVDDPRAS
ncbi:MAG: glycosyltransferase family 2 protein [Methylacidiphilales bacterium]|nr:glycosyltransferase family 2 protein [Candidatus Methylacidiphilales bacterium]MDW8349964.1 glycosyltransferase family 2 protein [Verrucomicrobiae bacterium]